MEVVADARRARETLGWTPRFDDLDTIVRHALQWEEQMQSRIKLTPMTVAHEAG